jgi:Fe-S oxidoreductase
MAELAARGETAEVLFWVGCAGSFDERAKKVTKAVTKILNHAGVSFAVLGAEESCTGDPARRAGNEFLFQMQALTNIEVLNGYSVQKIVAACPHCFNTLKNEYPQLGGSYEVFHHSQFIEQLLRDGRLRVEGGSFKGKRIVFHDPCYLGRVNGEYEAPRALLEKLDAEIHEMKRSKKNGFCCGAGGAQIFKEPEAGTAEVHHVRTEEALATGADIIAVGCPFCKLMLTDGVTLHGKEGQVQVLDIAEAIATANDL